MNALRMVLLMCYFHNQDQDWPYQFSSEIILSLFVTHPQKRKKTIHAYFGLIFWMRFKQGVRMSISRHFLFWIIAINAQDVFAKQEFHLMVGNNMHSMEDNYFLIQFIVFIKYCLDTWDEWQTLLSSALPWHHVL